MALVGLEFRGSAHVKCGRGKAPEAADDICRTLTPRISFVIFGSTAAGSGLAASATASGPAGRARAGSYMSNSKLYHFCYFLNWTGGGVYGGLACPLTGLHYDRGTRRRGPRNFCHGGDLMQNKTGIWWVGSGRDRYGLRPDPTMKLHSSTLIRSGCARPGFAFWLDPMYGYLRMRPTGRGSDGTFVMVEIH